MIGVRAESIKLVIPGEPVAQGRPRFSRFSRGRALDHPVAFDPPKSRSWKRDAARLMRDVVSDTAGTMPLFPDGALELEVLAVFRCPKSDERKTSPAPSRWKSTRPDAENIAKAVQDAGTGVLWGDDAQVARLVASKVIAPQGGEPRVEVIVRRLRPESVFVSAGTA